MTTRKDHAFVAAAAIIFALAAVYILWPSGPAPMAQRPSPADQPSTTIDQPPPAIHQRPYIHQQMTALREEVAAASRLGTSPARGEKLLSLETTLRTLETTLDPTSLAAVEVLELRHQIALAQRKPDEARKAIHGWLAARGFTGRRPLREAAIPRGDESGGPAADPADGAAGQTASPRFGPQLAGTLDRLYERHFGRLRARLDHVGREPFSQDKMARISDVERDLRRLGSNMPTDTKAAAKYEALLQRAMLAQAEYGLLRAELARWLTEVAEREGHERAAILGTWRAEHLAKTGLKPEARSLFREVGNRYPATERGAYGAYQAGLLFVEQRQYTAARACFEQVIQHNETGRWVVESYRTLAAVFAGQRQWEDAAATLDLLARLHPDSRYAAWAVLRAARYRYYRAGRRADAIAAVNAMRQRYPNSKQMRHAARLLRLWRGETVDDVLGKRKPPGHAPPPPAEEAPSQARADLHSDSVSR